MKKLLAAILAAVLTLGTATVALADNTVLDVSLDYDLYQYDEEMNRMDDTSVGYAPVQGGITLYIPVSTKAETDDGLKYKNTVSTGYMRNYRLKLDTSESNGMISGAQWKVAPGTDYKDSMFVAITVEKNNTKKNLEVSFVLTVTPKDDTDATVESFNDSEDYEYTLYLAPGSGAAAQPTTGSDTATGTDTTASSTTAETTMPSNMTGDVTKAIATAKQNGVASPRADVNVTNESGISAKDLQALVSAAKNAGGNVRILADTTTDGTFVGRLYLQPASVAAITTNISYGVTVSGDAVASTKAMFEKYYNNNVAVVRLAQDGTFGFPVEIAAKTDLSALNTKSLMFYSYNRATGMYYAISAPAYRVDDAGFLHFNTTLAGDIIITDKVLTAK